MGKEQQEDLKGKIIDAMIWSLHAATDMFCARRYHPTPIGRESVEETHQLALAAGAIYRGDSAAAGHAGSGH